MNQFITSHLPGAGRPVVVGQRSDGWRRVPRINLLPRTERGPAATFLVGGLIVIILVEALIAWNAYSDRTATQEGTETARQDLAAVQRQLSAEENEAQSLHSQIIRLDQRRGSEGQVFEGVSGGRIDWGASLTALFSAETPGVRFQSVTTLPETGDVDLEGTAADEGAIVSFLSRIGDVSEALDLRSSGWQEGNASLVFTASFEVRQNAPRE